MVLVVVCVDSDSCSGDSDGDSGRDSVSGDR
jgi:hypothetical protein